MDLLNPDVNQHANQTRFVPHLAIFETPTPEHRAVREEVRVEKLTALDAEYTGLPRFDHKADAVSARVIVQDVIDAPPRGESYGSHTHKKPVSRLDIRI